MWRTRAVISMLVSDIAGVQTPASPTEESDRRQPPAEMELLSRAIRRARFVILIDCLALVILFVFRDQTRPFLPTGQTVETVFTAGVLVVAAHAGFRLAQLESLRAVRRLCRDLEQRREG